MKKNFMTTAVLGGVLLLLVLWYAVYEKNIKVQRNEAKEKTKLLISLDRKDIQELEIDKLTNAAAAEREKDPEAPKYDKFKFKKLDNSWHLTGPLEDLADTNVMSSIMSTLATAKHEREISDKPEDLSAYGLKNPNVRVRVRKNSSDSFEEVWLGKDTPVGYSVYAIVGKEKNKVYRVARSLKNSFDKTLKDYRNKAVIKVSTGDVEEIEVVNRYGSFLLTRVEGNDWSLSRENIPADGKQAKALLSTIVDLRAKDFVSEKPTLAKFGLDKPVSTVWFKLKSKKQRKGVILGKKGDKVYAKRNDGNTIYEVDKKTIDIVSKPSKEFRSLALAEFNRFNIKRISFERGKQKLELLKEDKGWKLPSEPTAQIDTNKVEALIAKVQDTKITRYASGKTPNTGLKKPSLVLRLSDSDGAKENIVLSFGNKQRKQIFVQREKLNLPFLINLSDFEKIDLKKSAFLKKEPKKSKSEKLSEKAPKKKG